MLLVHCLLHLWRAVDTIRRRAPRHPPPVSHPPPAPPRPSQTHARRSIAHTFTAGRDRRHVRARCTGPTRRYCYNGASVALSPGTAQNPRTANRRITAPLRRQQRSSLAPSRLRSTYLEHAVSQHHVHKPRRVVRQAGLRRRSAVGLGASSLQHVWAQRQQQRLAQPRRRRCCLVGRQAVEGSRRRSRFKQPAAPVGRGRAWEGPRRAASGTRQQRELQR